MTAITGPNLGQIAIAFLIIIFVMSLLPRNAAIWMAAVIVVGAIGYDQTHSKNPLLPQLSKYISNAGGTL